MADIIRTVRDIDTADRVVLRVTDPASGREQSLTSFVDGVTEEGILVSVPQQVGPRISFRQDSLVAVSIWKGHAAHCFPSRIVGFNDGPPPQLILSSPRSHEIERKPRRGYFRVNVTIPVQMHLHGGIVQNATMLNLSAGGCRILTPKEVDDERLEYLDFDLPFPPDSDHLDQIRPLRRIRGHISGTAVFGSGASAPASSFAVSIGFEGLAGVARDVIMRYVAYRQRQLAHPERAPAAAPGHTQPAGDLPGSARETTADGGHLSESQPAEPTATLLLVEDERDLRETLAELLQADGYKVLQAPNGREALRVIKRIHVDLVLTDLMMPVMNGWRLVASLRDNDIDVPVVVMTGYMAQEGPEVLTSQDIAAFVPKPLDLAHLTATLRHVLSAPSEKGPSRILVVYDSRDVPFDLTEHLQQADYEVDVSPGGKEAFEILDRSRPDLILLDILQPKVSGMDGFELCERLRSQPEFMSIPVIMMATEPSSEHVQKALQLKVRGLIAKPVSRETLITRVDQVLKRTRPVCRL